MKRHCFLFIPVFLLFTGCEFLNDVDRDPCTEDYHAEPGHTFPMSIEDIDWAEYFTIGYSYPDEQTAIVTVLYKNYASYVCPSPNIITYHARIKLNSSFWNGLDASKNYIAVFLYPAFGKCSEGPLDYQRFDDEVELFGDQDFFGYMKTKAKSRECPPSNCENNYDGKNTFYILTKIVFFLEMEVYQEKTANPDYPLRRLINEAMKEIEYVFDYTR